MRGLPCLGCGVVRWDSPPRCAECGCAARVPDLPARLAVAPPRRRRRRILEVAWRAVSTSQPPAKSRRRELIEVGLAITLVATSALTLYFYDSSRLAGPRGSAQVVFPAGEQFPSLTTGGVNGYGFTVNRSGTLTGSFSSSGPAVEICVATDFTGGETPWHPYPFTQRPGNVTYSTGFVLAGNLSVAVVAGTCWLVVFPGPNATEYASPWSVTWSPGLQIVPT